MPTFGTATQNRLRRTSCKKPLSDRYWTLPFSCATYANWGWNPGLALPIPLLTNPGFGSLRGQFEELTYQDYERFTATFDATPQTMEPKCALFYAATQGHLPMTKYLVERQGADPQFFNLFGMSTLVLASRFGHTETCRYILPRLSHDHICSVSKGLGLSAIGDAAKCGHPDVVRLLLEYKADVSPRRKNGKTPLHEAAERGFAECVRLLCAAGADRHTVDNEGKTAAHLAAEATPVRTEVLKVLESYETRPGRGWRLMRWVAVLLPLVVVVAAYPASKARRRP